MAIFEFSATISPGQRHDWWTGGGGWYVHDHRPQLDAHSVPTFPEGISYTGIQVPLWYGDFSCQLESTDFFGNDFYTYYVSVVNKGADTTMYHMRVWVP
jgi:hypothetical protein